jgi:hypothetical protein
MESLARLPIHFDRMRVNRFGKKRDRDDIRSLRPEPKLVCVEIPSQPEVSDESFVCVCALAHRIHDGADLGWWKWRKLLI